MTSDESLVLSEQGRELLLAVREALDKLRTTEIRPDDGVAQKLREALEDWEAYEIARKSGVDIDEE